MNINSVYVEDEEEIYVIDLPEAADNISLDSRLPLYFSLDRASLVNMTGAVGRHPGLGIQTIPLGTPSKKLFIQSAAGDEEDVYAHGFNGNAAPFFVPYTYDRSLSEIQQDLSSADALLRSGEIKLATIDEIDATEQAETNLYTVPAGHKAVVTRAIVRLEAEDSATGALVVGVGVAAGAADIVSPATLTGLTDAGTYAVLSPAVGAAVADAGDIIKLGIDTAFGGTSAEISGDLFGYLIPVE